MDYTGLSILPFGRIGERLGAADESFGLIEASFTPPSIDCKAATETWFRLASPVAPVSHGKTLHQNCEVFRRTVANLSELFASLHGRPGGATLPGEVERPSRRDAPYRGKWSGVLGETCPT